MKPNYPDDIIQRAKQVNALIFDVDGVLTDGRITYDANGVESKSFNVKDGQIIKHLREANILVGAITGRYSQMVKKRCEEMKLDFYYQGVDNKKDIFSQICKKYELQYRQVAYIGDDIIDLGILSQCGLAVVPANAVSYVQAHADWITNKKGGEGVVREVGDLLLSCRGLQDSIVEQYLNQ